MQEFISQLPFPVPAFPEGRFCPYCFVFWLALILLTYIAMKGYKTTND